MRIPTHEEIALAAHQIWEAAGCPPDRDTEFWLEAETRLLELLPEDEHSAASVLTAPVFSESYRDRAIADAATEQRHEARSPIVAHKSAPKAKPPESGKPLWNQPHSR